EVEADLAPEEYDNEEGNDDGDDDYDDASVEDDLDDDLVALDPPFASAASSEITGKRPRTSEGRSIGPSMKELQVRDMALMRLAKGYLLDAMRLPKDMACLAKSKQQGVGARDSKRRQEKGAEDEDCIVHLAKSMEDSYYRKCGSQS
ncbi:hypothetical protein BGZ52_011189, partial [Haplosporangium bisporale]